MSGRNPPHASVATSPPRLVFVVAVAVSAALLLVLGLNWRFEVRSLESQQRVQALRRAELARVLLDRRLERGRLFVRGIAESRAVQEALAARNSRRLEAALRSFRSDLGATYIVVADSAGRPLTWSTPVAALALAGGGGELAREAPAGALMVAGDLAARFDAPVSAAGRRLGEVRAAVLIGRLFLEQSASDLGGPLALFRKGSLAHQTVAGDIPPPAGEAWRGALFGRWAGAQISYDVAYVPLPAFGGDDLWLGALVPRTTIRAARRRYLGLLLVLGVGGLGLVLLIVGGFLAAARRRERRLLAQRDEALHLSEGLSDRLARLTAVVHDIKAPVGGIQLRCEGLADDAEDAGLRVGLDQVIDTCERLNLYLVNVLTAAQAEEDSIPLEQEVVLLPGLVEEVSELVASLASRAGVSLGTESPDDVPPVRGDSGLLERALWNLASNALAVTPAGGTVTLFARRRSDAIELGVRDSGPGFRDFPPEEAFSRGRPKVQHASFKAGSTGLGLYIVHRIAALHGGSAVARNLPEGGAEVAIELPIAVRASGA